MTLDHLGGPGRFFRLRLRLLPTTIRDSSPAKGEKGVAVIRETIVRFTRPLAPTTMVTSTNFLAAFGGRKLLSRIELSSDRKTVSLFYLEPLSVSILLVESSSIRTFACSSEVGIQTLSLGGVYTIIVHGIKEGTGEYSSRFVPRHDLNDSPLS